jgi:MTH538 TIR-like domain (DUF1863)
VRSYRIFISYQHDDQLKAKGLNLMRYNKPLGMNFVSRGLLDPVKSQDPRYIETQIKQRLQGTSVTIVLLGDSTADSIWVENEIRWSNEKDPPNGLLAIKLTPDAEVPAGLEGAEVLNWNKPEDVLEFPAAIERAYAGIRRMSDAQALVGHSDGGGCGR